MDVRPPIDDIKRLTLNDPRFALAFRTMIDKKVSADQRAADLANQKKGERNHPNKRNENISAPNPARSPNGLISNPARSTGFARTS